MASKSLQELQDKLQSIQYTPKTDEQIKAQAEGEYKSYYDQLRLAAQQQKDASDLALQQRREGLKATYDKQRERAPGIMPVRILPLIGWRFPAGCSAAAITARLWPT